MDWKPEQKFGVSPREDISHLTGREFLQAIIDGRLPAPPIAKTLSIQLVEVGDGFCVFEGVPGPHLLNPLGGVHGGWALTLIDSVTGCAAHSTLPAGVSYATIETKANLSRPIAAGHRPRARRGAGGRPGPNDHLRRGQDRRRERASARARDVDRPGAEAREKLKRPVRHA